MNNIVMGLDTASSRLHYFCTFPLAGEGEGTQYGGFHAADKTSKDEQRQELYEMAHRLFGVLHETGSEEHKKCHIFCEEPLALKNGKTTRLLALAAGAIWAANLDYNIWWHWVDVASWKKAIVGRGNASKEDVANYCWGNPAFQHEVKDPHIDQDIYDAWCLKVYGVQFVTLSDSVAKKGV